MAFRVNPRPTGPVRVKVCGLTTEALVEAAASAGAAYIGLVFYPRSPRSLAMPLARDLALAVPVGVAKVALFVDPTDAEVDAVLDTVPIDMVQLHGHEPPDRVTEVRARWGLPVMKAVGISGPEDMARARAYEGVADQLLLDAKAPAGSTLPGGNGVSFDWGLLSGLSWSRPWMLAGGLAPGNVAEAVRVSGARQVDVSSGVESAPGVKDPDLIRAFVGAAASAR